ncbi:component of SufBCD complex [Rhodobacter sp. CZR27]|uniref:component of SufBCD complex n=1 Tax=Rhodobacter sp. CZR27 TaxID=2033869 RepID=UPI000BBF0571|nr:component of SufBCD complex [Rhodobacter sp. CZR27]
MDFYASISEVIDLRSFSNLWFWIALAVMWSTVSHWVMGVPWDLVQRARRRGGPAGEDVHQLARIYAARLRHMGSSAGAWLVGVVAFLLTTLGLLGFVYGLEFAQALLCLMLPMTLVGALSLHTAARIEPLEGPALYHALASHRRRVQALGVVSIFVTAMWGMYQNLRIGVL